MKKIYVLLGLVALALGLLGASEFIETGTTKVEDFQLTSGQALLASSGTLATWQGALQVVADNPSSSTDATVVYRFRGNAPSLIHYAGKSYAIPVQFEQFNEIRKANTALGDTVIVCRSGTINLLLMGS